MNGRLVFITQEQRDWISHYSAMAGVRDVFGELTDAYDAASDDVMHVAGKAIGHEMLMPPRYCEHVTLAVLRALGWEA